MHWEPDSTLHFFCICFLRDWLLNCYNCDQFVPANSNLMLKKSFITSFKLSHFKMCSIDTQSTADKWWQIKVIIVTYESTKIVYINLHWCYSFDVSLRWILPSKKHRDNLSNVNRTTISSPLPQYGKVNRLRNILIANISSKVTLLREFHYLNQITITRISLSIIICAKTILLILVSVKLVF